MVAVKQRVSVEEYLAIPDWRKPYLEYMDGEVREKVTGDLTHAGIVYAVSIAFGPHVRAFKGVAGPEVRCEFLGPNETAYLLPDFAYWPKGRPRNGVKAALPPMLAVEVRSPGESMAAQHAKCRFYRDHGVEIAWLIDPRSETVEVCEGELDAAVLRAGRVLTSPLLPGFELPVADLFVDDDE